MLNFLVICSQYSDCITVEGVIIVFLFAFYLSSLNAFGLNLVRRLVLDVSLKNVKL